MRKGRSRDGSFFILSEGRRLRWRWPEPYPVARQADHQDRRFRASRTLALRDLLQVAIQDQRPALTTPRGKDSVADAIMMQRSGCSLGESNRPGLSSSLLLPPLPAQSVAWLDRIRQEPPRHARGCLISCHHPSCWIGVGGITGRAIGDAPASPAAGPQSSSSSSVIRRRSSARSLKSRNASIAITPSRCFWSAVRV